MSFQKHTHLIIGNFDGVHLGHQALIQQARTFRTNPTEEIALLTFAPHPLAVLNPQKLPQKIQEERQNLALLAAYQVDRCIRWPFSLAFAQQAPLAFCQFLEKHFSLRTLTIGENFRFGHQRVGTPEFLTEYFSRDNHIVHPLSAVQCQQQTVSSSKIRQFLQNGQIHEANTFLGRPFFNQGRVATGLKIGRTLGFPTANLTDIHTLMPKSGVYSTVSLVEEKWFASVTHIGVRPTLGTRPKGMESHFIGYPSGATCYDKTVTTLFFNRLREERRFPDGQALRDQIAQDLALRQQTAEDDLRWGQEALKGPLTTHGESILDNYAPDQPLC